MHSTYHAILLQIKTKVVITGKILQNILKHIIVYLSGPIIRLYMNIYRILNLLVFAAVLQILQGI